MTTEGPESVIVIDTQIDVRKDMVTVNSRFERA
jgi:hypothetical protein